MLSEKELHRIALDECVKMLGAELVSAHKDLCCGSVRTTETGEFSYTLGVDTKEKPLRFGDETPMEYYACVVVDRHTGKVERDIKNSVLPN